MVDFETGAVTGTAQSELAAYYAGLLGQVGRKAQGDDYLASFTELQATFGVIPESIDVTTRQPRRKHTGLRPEYPDACLNLWLEGRDVRYRRLAAIHYREMKATSRAAFGYTALKDITTTADDPGRQLPGLLVVRADEILLPAVLRHAAHRLRQAAAEHRGQRAAGVQDAPGRRRLGASRRRGALID
jgi:hypothetical protein